MFGIGGGEMIFIIFIALMLFGSDKIPTIARSLGKMMAQLKNATNEIKNEIHNSAEMEEVNSTMKSLTNSFTQEVDKVKESVISTTNLDLGENAITNTSQNLDKMKQDIDDLTGPIKRQL